MKTDIYENWVWVMFQAKQAAFGLILDVCFCHLKIQNFEFK